LIPRAYGGLGYAIPAVVGAHFAQADAKLVGVFGDGSLGMSAGELETVARLNIPAVLIHCNNAMYGWIKALQKLHSKEKYFSVDFTPGNPSLVAEGFGVKALIAQSGEELESALEEAFSTDGPVFIDALTETEVAELPPVYSWLKVKDRSG
jgi:acetolactate synthase-1/2/3 large subunit